MPLGPMPITGNDLEHIRPTKQPEEQGKVQEGKASLSREEIEELAFLQFNIP